jgi:hypothetical protein
MRSSGSGRPSARNGRDALFIGMRDAGLVLPSDAVLGQCRGSASVVAEAVLVGEFVEAAAEVVVERRVERRDRWRQLIRSRRAEDR